MLVRIISALLVVFFGFLQPTSAAVAGPMGYHVLCLKKPVLCSADMETTRAVSPIEYTAETAMLLHSVNNKWNKKIVQRVDSCTNQPSYTVSGCDIWSGSTSVGDCEEIALAKKMDLLRRGFSASQLLLTVVRNSDGQGHLVLVVRTTAGNMVLDNLREAMLPWKKAGYPLVQRQSEARPSEWTKARL